MGNYNPHTPHILGQEWVPIRDESLVFDELTASFEQGTGFTLTENRQVNSGAFYLHQRPQGVIVDFAQTMTVYEADKLNASGPVRSVLIPCNSGGVTGNVTIVSPSITVPNAVWAPDIGTVRGLLIQTGSSAETVVNFFFAVNDYAQILANKRILRVDFRVQYRTSDGTPTETPAGLSPLRLNFGYYSGNIPQYGVWQFLPQIAIPGSPPPDTLVNKRYRVGNVNLFYNNMSTTAWDLIPWTYDELRKFEVSHPQRITTFLHSIAYAPPGPVVYFRYIAMEVFYCDENRKLFGSTLYNNTSTVLSLYDYFNPGANYIKLRDVANPSGSNPILTPGNYVVTLAQGDMGDNAGTIFKPGPHPLINAIREKYVMPSQPGYRLNLPFPLDESAVKNQKTIEPETVEVLPQLSLHASGSGVPLTEVHSYGRQVAAQVYGSIYAEQEISDSSVTGTVSFPYVRFYARRFGNTTVPLTLSGASPLISGAPSQYLVSITPMEFDALDPMVDGWKEVNLEFPVPPGMGSTGAGTPSWRWTATGELPGNRWEVLGASAPAISGVPGNLMQLVIPSTRLLYETTYLAPTGATQELKWVPQGIGSPWVSGAGIEDDTSDATLIFSQQMPMVTGLTLTTLCQNLTGIGQNCDVDPCCIPTSLLYNHLTWSFPLNSSYALDSFDRTVSNGLGNADVGGAYTIIGASTQYSVNGSKAFITPNTINADNFGVINAGINFDITASIGVYNTIVSGSNARVGLVGRYTDVNNHYIFQLQITSASVMTLVLSERVGGSSATLVSQASNVTVNAGGMVRARFMGYGDFLKAKIWTIGEDEPDTWNIETNDTSLATGSLAGLFARSETVTGNTMQFEDLEITPPTYWFGSLELQRSDTVDTEWQTIMESSSPAITAFNDFEARVGIDTSYRIRAINVYDFTGPWSSTVSTAISEPGVGIGCGGGHILIFTSNQRQDGSANLAYSSIWMDSAVSENFTFPEASFVQLQPMYDRDYFTAFRPLERGGEQFQRTILVQAAAISPPTLADFTSMRDLCWEPVNYICVRDEDGNRWMATVQLPSGTVLNNRRLYMAPIQVTEVTRTPTPVDPSDAEVLAGTVIGGECDDVTCSDAAIVAEDDFSREVVNGWGVTSDGTYTWSDPTGEPITVYSVDDSGFMDFTGSDIAGFQALTDINQRYVNLQVELDCVTGTGTMDMSIYARVNADGSQYYRATATFDLDLEQITSISVARHDMTLATTAISVPFASGTPSIMRFTSGIRQSAKIWSSLSAEPADWQVEGADDSLNAGAIALGSEAGLGPPAPPAITTTPIWMWGCEQGTVSDPDAGVSGFRLISSESGSTAYTYTAAGTGSDGVGSAIQWNVVASPMFFSVGNLSEGGFPLPNATAGVFYVRFVTALPNADCELLTISSTAFTSPVLSFRNSDDALIVTPNNGGTIRVGPTIVANTWYRIDWAFDSSTSPAVFQWSVAGVPQTNATFTFVAPGSQRAFLYGNSNNITANVMMDNFYMTQSTSDYPIGDIKIVRLMPEATVVELSDANAMARFTSNGGGLDATFNASDILTAITEFPPVIGGTAAGAYLRLTDLSATIGSIRFPMTTYTATASERIQYLRVIWLAWSPTNNINSFNVYADVGGSVSTLFTGINAAPDINVPPWFAAFYTPSGGWDQTKLDALRVALGGPSNDINPTPGVHVVQAEVAIRFDSTVSSNQTAIFDNLEVTACEFEG